MAAVTKLACVVNESIHGWAHLTDEGGWWQARIELACDWRGLCELRKRTGALRLGDGTVEEAVYLDVAFEDGRTGRAIFLRARGWEQVIGGTPDDYCVVEVVSQTPLKAAATPGAASPP